MTWTVHWPIQRIKANELLSIEISGKQGLTLGMISSSLSGVVVRYRKVRGGWNVIWTNTFPLLSIRTICRFLLQIMCKSKSRHYTDLPAEGGVPLRLGIKRLISEALKQGLRLDPTQTLHQQAVSKIRSTILQ